MSSSEKVASKSSAALITLVVTTYIFILTSSLCGVVEQVLFYRNAQWNNGIGLYVGVGILIFLILNTVIVFLRRNEVAVSWLVPHIHRAWSMLQWTWIASIALIIIAIVFSSTETEKNVDRILDQAAQVWTFVVATLFIPWSVYGLWRVNADLSKVKRLGDAKINSNGRKKGSWRTVLEIFFVFSDDPVARVHDHTDTKKKLNGTKSVQKSDMRSEWSRITDEQGDEYIGDLKNGIRHGRGTLNYSDGGQYVGEFVNGKCNGKGAYVAPDGTRYLGDFKNGEWHGIGTLTTPEGDKYVGTFDQGMISGSGTLECANGERYTGSWKDDKPDGYGTYIYADGNTYKGGFSLGIRNGTGTYVDTDGNIYEGDWAEDNFYGQGTYTWANGDRHVGSWRAGKRHGFGTFTTTGGKELTGLWTDDNFASDQEQGTKEDIETSPSLSSRIGMVLSTAFGGLVILNLIRLGYLKMMESCETCASWMDSVFQFFGFG